MRTGRRRSCRVRQPLAHKEDFIRPGRERIEPLQATVVVEMQMGDMEELLQASHDGHLLLESDPVELDHELLGTREDFIRGLRQCGPLRAFDVHFDDDRIPSVPIPLDLILEAVEDSRRFIDTGNWRDAFGMELGISRRAHRSSGIETVGTHELAH